MHSEWCGKACAECKHPCRLDQEIYCSPDCPCLGADGEMDAPECVTCDAYRAAQEDELLENGDDAAIDMDLPLPDEMELSLEDVFDEEDAQEEFERIAEAVSEHITALTGFCHEGFHLNIILEVSEIAYDIDDEENYDDEAEDEGDNMEEDDT